MCSPYLQQLQVQGTFRAAAQLALRSKHICVLHTFRSAGSVAVTNPLCHALTSSANTLLASKGSSAPQLQLAVTAQPSSLPGQPAEGDMGGTHPRWPKGWLAVVATGGVLIGTLIAFVPAARTLPVLAQTFSVGLALFKSAAGVQGVMIAAWVAHVLEAVFLTYPLCRKHKLPVQHTRGWVALTLLMGYPSIVALNDILQQEA